MPSRRDKENLNTQKEMKRNKFFFNFLKKVSQTVDGLEKKNTQLRKCCNNIYTTICV